MTGWTNMGVFGPDSDAVLRALLDEYDPEMGTSAVVNRDPPTVRLWQMNKRERKEIATETLHNLGVEVTTVVLFENGNTSDWGTAYIYEEPDDLRDVTLVETISGKSGLHAADVEQELASRGYPVSKQHFYNEYNLSKEDCAELYID